MWDTGEVYKVEVYARVRRAVQVDGMSIRQAARDFGLARKTIRKMLQFSLPPGYERKKPIQRPKLGPWLGIIDQILGACPSKAPRRFGNARVSSTKSSWGNDGYAVGGRCCCRSVRSPILIENHSPMPLISSAWRRRAVKCYVSGTAGTTPLLLSFFRVARIVEIREPV